MIGPTIPEHLLKKKSIESEITISDEEDDRHIGPQIPQDILQKRQQNKAVNSHAAIGPQILEDLVEQKNEQFDKMNDTCNDYVPELPPDLLEQRQKRQKQPAGRRRQPIGPSLPSEFITSQEEEEVIGPSLPKDYNPEEEAKYSAIQAIEERVRLTNSSRSRQFSNKDVGEIDSSSWTDTPAEKERKRKEGTLGKRKAEEPIVYSSQDIERRRAIEEYNMKTRPMSLLEIHRQKKKKSKETPEDVSKRPFDREKDLLAPKRMDSKQKKELLRQSGELNSMFGHGKSSFL
ncbi:hypothetical protein BCV72DRAFT_217598 [Rhizopus microsporus var. microsporus]|uniref:DUF3752 domain-containing protein n=1 Tax=Rhizopus microsporus var. microsporus TaxID=86635 RepID=A0A1X0QNH0_RHIZD|nr:hypothetical protein BCV72DRAFT_217598 [Rhizopus microsporus var. microsporus]